MSETSDNLMPHSRTENTRRAGVDLHLGPDCDAEQVPFTIDYMDASI
jgi:hypothetical protein